MEVRSLISQLFDHDILITPEQAKLLTPEHAATLAGMLDDPRAAERYLSELASGVHKQPPAQTAAEPQPRTKVPLPNGEFPPVQVLQHYSKKPKKRSYQDFVQHFNVRFKGLERFLRGRGELANVTSIDRLSQGRGRPERQRVSIIGLVLEKRDTKNEHIILEIEDRSGSINVLCSKNKPALHDLAKDLSLDEMIGITGTLQGDIIFADEITLPGIPPSNQLKRAPDEAYAVCFGDTEFGSKEFFTERFETFIRWLRGETGSPEARAIAAKVKYVFITGDTVAGVGVFPTQEQNLSVPDIYQQYALADEAFSRIPEDKHVILIPGNHDIGRLSEPQPGLPRELFPKLAAREHVHFLSNPSWVRIHQTKDFPGFTCLLYHGGSFIYYGNNVLRLFQEGGMSNPCAVMQYLLQRRHLAPTHTATLYVPDAEEDHLIIHDIPDFLISGHLHTTQHKTWNGITMLSCSCWVPTNDYQIKQGLKIDPGKFMLINLQTRAVEALRPEELE